MPRSGHVALFFASAAGIKWFVWQRTSKEGRKKGRKEGRKEGESNQGTTEGVTLVRLHGRIEAYVPGDACVQVKSVRPHPHHSKCGELSDMKRRANPKTPKDTENPRELEENPKQGARSQSHHNPNGALSRREPHVFLRLWVSHASANKRKHSEDVVAAWAMSENVRATTGVSLRGGRSNSEGGGSGLGARKHPNSSANSSSSKVTPLKDAAPEPTGALGDLPFSFT